jgi:hypothetical protein
LVNAFHREHLAGVDSESGGQVAARNVDGAHGGLQIEVCLGTRGGGFKFVGLGSQAVLKACLRVLLNCLDVFQPGFGCLALPMGTEKPVVSPGNLEDDSAMRAVECKIPTSAGLPWQRRSLPIVRQHRAPDIPRGV